MANERGPAPTGEGAGPSCSTTLADDDVLLAERWHRFHHQHPWIYRRLVSRARRLRRQSPHRRLSINLLFELERLEPPPLATGETPVLNNDYRSFYARLIMAQEPDLADAFETRSSTADRLFGLVRWPGTDIVLGSGQPNRPEWPGGHRAEGMLW